MKRWIFLLALIVAGIAQAQVDAVSVKTFGAKCDGITNDAPAITLALAASQAVKLPHNATCVIAAKVTVPANKRLFGSGYNSVLKKGFNGDMIELGVKGELDHFRIDGAGATYTGRGVIIVDGAGGDGWQSIHDMTILDTQSYCIEYTAAGAGWQSRIVSNRLDTYNLTTYTTKFPTADINGPRTFANNVSLGPLVDIADSLGVNVVGNGGGEGPAGGPYTVPTIKINDAAQRAVVVGNTFESSTSITIKGGIGIWSGNIMRGGYTLGAGSSSNFIAGNIGTAGGGPSAYDTDNSGNQTNDIYGVSHTYTPTWAASGVQPVLNNGTITGRYQRFGRQVEYQVVLAIGTTTTIGTGTYTFSLPPGVPAPVAENVASAWIFRSGVAIFVGTGFVSSAGITAYGNNTATQISATVPFAWANGDRIIIGGTYRID